MNEVSLKGIHFNSEGVENRQDEVPFLYIRKEEVQSIALRRGKLSNNPTMQQLLGTAFTILGFFAIVTIVQVYKVTGVLPLFELNLYLTAFIPIGVWVIHDALKQGYYLEIATQSTSRKFRFEKMVNQPEVANFIDELHNSTDYKIENNLF